MKVTGACHCGSITIEGEADPEKVTICHCTDCQTGTGSAFRVSVPIPGNAFKMKGQPTNYVKTTADSGNPRVQAFCPNAARRSIRPRRAKASRRPTWCASASCEQRDQLAPKRQNWFRSARPWVTHWTRCRRTRSRRDGLTPSPALIAAIDNLHWIEWRRCTATMTTRRQEHAMIVTVFRSRLMPGLQDEYVALVDRMQQIAKHHPGLHLAQGLLGRRRRARHHRRVRARGGPARLADASGAHGGAEAGRIEVLRDLRHPGLQCPARGAFRPQKVAAKTGS